MNIPLKVLVIEDDPDLAANLVDFLAARGHLVDAAGDGVTGLHLATIYSFDVILLDLILPGIDGITLCRRLRNEGSNITPVLMLTARDTLEDKVAGLEAGADDYLVKPFALREVEARLHALARRANAAFAHGELRVADLVFDPKSLRITRAGVHIVLPPIPLRLLEALMRASPKVLSRNELEHAAWGDAPPDSDALRAHLHILRNAIDKPFRPPLIQTLRGLGWQIMPPHGSPP
ncbi:MAG: response regulator transcription factor [Gammaproteobacteria bacterium]|nr:response regulator transcription factor [Gammaproteobacteria bacterium]MBU1414709.1 response regulator transcription factor [Gammaproteobacteria bacterium]